MPDPEHPPTRRRLLQRGATLLGLTAALTATQASADNGKIAKDRVKYQFTPNGAARCGLCVSFIPAKQGPADGPGTCKLVDGPIPQTGWCPLFSPAL